MNFFAYWFSDRMVLRRYRAHEVGPEDGHRMYRIVAQLAERADLPMPKVFVIPSKAPNAFATGRNPRHAAVAATEGILDALDDEELAGVMAHELTHVKNRDILTGTLAATFAGAIAMLSQMARLGAVHPSDRRQNPIMLLLVAVGMPMVATIVRMAISRTREYAADEGAVEISGQSIPLANALIKISRGASAVPLERANPGHAHLFIVNPFAGGGFQKLLASHPPMEERVSRLHAMAKQGDAELRD